ncbi:MAG: hypothetical protein RH980_18710 [Roseovarius confluentis]|jgi:hypothetical protein
MSVVNRPPFSAQHLDAGLRRALIATAAQDRAICQESWLLAKERQGHPINGERLMRLEDAPTTWPGAQRPFEAPMMAGHELSELEATIATAGPTISRAVRRALRLGQSA